MIGALCGDIIGSVFEFVPTKRMDFEFFAQGCDFTDDTVMTCAVAEAIMRAEDEGVLDEGKIADEFRLEELLVASMQRLGRMYPCPTGGYGSRFSDWIFDENPKPYNSWGNGSAMRVSPAGWCCNNLEDTLALAAATSAVTHDHPEGIKGAQATAGCIFLARTGTTKEEIARFATEEMGYDVSVPIDEIRPGYLFDVSCQGSVPQSIRCFLEADSYEETVRLAVSLGGDADTQAAIAGSIAEAFFGVPDEIAEKGRSCLPAPLLAILDAQTERMGR